jgi:hypothetical protein
MQKRKLWFGLAALAAGWGFDFLFWGRQGGLSFLVWTALLLILGYVLAWREKVKPSVWSIVLTVLILGFAVIPAWRSESFTRFSSTMVTLLGLLLLISTFLNGHWLHFRVVDFITRMFTSIGAGITRGFGLLAADENGVPPLPGQKTKSRRFGSIVLGIVMALPIVIMLGAILASADPIFSDTLQNIFNTERLPEYLFRFVYIVIGSYLILGLLLHAILPKKDPEKPETNKASMKPFLGWTECAIVLGAVDILFVLFVVIQVKYLFGGTANINAAGYTFSEYARRGFGELVAVAVISLVLYLVMNTITKRESKGSFIGFTVLSVLMMANVLVMLASSLQRLMLYESAYSFSELRTYTHVFIFWLAALILATIVFQIINRQGRFGLALMLMIVGFAATLGIMNVDGFVARQNIKLELTDATKVINDRARLDVNYLATLSSDAVPVLVEAFKDPTLAKDTHDLLGVTLACRTKEFVDAEATDWQSIRFGELQARKLLIENRSLWSSYIVTEDEYGNDSVKLGNDEYSCYGYDWMD